MDVARSERRGSDPEEHSPPKPGHGVARLRASALFGRDGKRRMGPAQRFRDVDRFAVTSLARPISGPCSSLLRSQFPDRAFKDRACRETDEDAGTADAAIAPKGPAAKAKVVRVGVAVTAHRTVAVKGTQDTAVIAAAIAAIMAAVSRGGIVAGVEGVRPSIRRSESPRRAYSRS